MLDLQFQRYNEIAYLAGSNADITIGNSIFMKNKYGFFEITMPHGYFYQNEHCIKYSGVEVYPTTNGIACRVSLSPQKEYIFRTRTSKPFYNVSHNEKYFAIMKEKFQPFVTISCIGAEDYNSEIIAPANIRYRMVGDVEVELTISTNTLNAQSVLFEVNLQEQKLFQDTTVESRNPEINNVFGGTAFIGKSIKYGEQWIYSRLDFSKLRDLLETSIQRTILYYPLLNKNNRLLSAFQLSTRFCSFGSNWNNKKLSTSKAVVSELISGYHKFDLTNMMVQKQKLLIQSEGWIIKSAIKKNCFSVISMGDSFYAPQILEVAFK